MYCYGYSLLVSVAQTRLLTLSLPEWMMEFVRWFKLLCLWTKSYGATIQLKSLWKYFHVELFALKIFYNWKWIWGFCQICLWSHLAVKGLMTNKAYMHKQVTYWNLFTVFVKTPFPCFLGFYCIWWKLVQCSCKKNLQGTVQYSYRSLQ